MKKYEINESIYINIYIYMPFSIIMKKILFSGINKKLIIYFYFNNIFKSFKYYNLNIII